jgi:2,3-dihydroxybiphenyl 1,2-dioxygenase
MAEVMQLGYLGIGARDVGEWENYAQSVLGLGIAGRDADGTTLLRLDGHHYRFAIHPDERDDVAYVGWQVKDRADMDAIAARLEAAGVPATRGTREDAERRRVQGLIRFDDPDGHEVEVFYGPEAAAAPFESTRADTSFVADEQGLGHLVLATSDLPRALDFYQSMLGMKLTDYVAPPGFMKLGFLHCNPRHHSIAFAEVRNPRKRINHFMLQLDEFDTVGRSYDEVQGGAAPLYVTMGRHPNDHMVSFYMGNPSRFGVEYGWGAIEVDDSCWQVTEHNIGSIWGHKPVPRPRT